MTGYTEMIIAADFFILTMINISEQIKAADNNSVKVRPGGKRNNFLCGNFRVNLIRVNQPKPAAFYQINLILGLFMDLIISNVLSSDPVSKIINRVTKGKTEEMLYQTNRSSFLTIIQAVICFI